LKVYFDTAYLGKCYWNEPDGEKVRRFAREADGIWCSAIAIAEMACLAHRKVREGDATSRQASARRDLFLGDIDSGVIVTIPVTETILRKVDAATRKLPAGCYVRAMDALHLVTAADSGFAEVWTNDKHMIDAAAHFGVRGRSL